MPDTPSEPEFAKIAASLTKAQRDIMLGELVDIPPHEADELQARDLKGEAYFVDETDGHRLIWPITPLGLAVRAHLKEPTT